MVAHWEQAALRASGGMTWRVLCCDDEVLVASIDCDRRVRSLCFVRALEPSEAGMQLHMLQWTVGKDAHDEITLSMRLCYSL
jgi:hypothetical protein